MNKPVGRPPKPPSTPPRTSRTLRMDAATNEILDRRAAEEHLTCNAYLVRLIHADQRGKVSEP